MFKPRVFTILLGGMVATTMFLGSSSTALAQSAGSIRGTVTDSTKAVVPGASVTLTNEATSFVRETVTDERGAYFFASVDNGDYRLKVEIAGFKTYEASGLHVSPNDTLGIDVVLQIGEQTEVITVTGTSQELIQPRSGAREGVISAAQIESLSVISRNPMELLRILPGVVTTDQTNLDRSGMFTGGSSGDLTVNGASSQSMAVSLDGANLRDVGANTGTLNVPNNEFIAEIKLESSNYAAEFGSAGVNILAVTKSGSSAFHGSAYDYVRNYRFAANDRSRSLIGQEKPKSEFNYPGFTVSGPVIFPGFNKERNKAFFFFGFEYARQRLDDGAYFGYTPTPGQRQGLFNDYLGGQHLNQPTVVNIPGGFPGAGTPAPNNDLRPYIDPIGQALINLYPPPNYNDPTNRYNYVFSQLTKEDRNQWVLRADYNVTEGTRAYVRLARDHDDRTKPRGMWWNSSGVELPTPVADTSLGRSVAANVTSVLSPTSTNEVIFTWSQLKNDNRWDDPSRVMLSTYGITGIENPFSPSPFVPQIVTSTFGEGTLWAVNDVEDVFSYNGFFRFGDTYTKVLDTHALKFGVGIERQYKNQNFQNDSNVRLQFAPWGNGSTGSDYGDLLVGRPESVVVGTPAAHGKFVAWNFEAFAQDSWRLHQNVTLEYGLRFGKWTNNVETNDLGTIFLPERYDQNAGLFLDPNRQRVNGVAYVATGDVDRPLTDSRPLLFMPRAGVAWDLRGNGNTIFRGGVGLFYSREAGNAQYGVINVPPNAYAATLNAYAYSGLGGGRGLTYTTIGLADPFSSLNSFNISSVNPDELEWPRLWNTSVSVARRLPWRQTAEVGYVGSFGRHLAAQRQFNVIPVGGISSGIVGNADLSNPLHRAALQDSVVNSLRPFPALQNVTYFEPIAETNYNSMQATLSRPAGSFQYFVAYTLSKATGNGHDFSEIDALDPSRSETVMPFDRRHIFNVSWTWMLGTPVEGNAFLKALANDWNLSGISTFTSGVPIRIAFNQGDLSNNDTARAWWGTSDFVDQNTYNPGDITPLYLCDPRLDGNEVNEKRLDVNCLGIPNFGETGPFRSPYDLRSPRRSYHDLTVFKNFSTGGDTRLQFRAGFFNLFNQAYPWQSDIDLNLETACNVQVSGVPDGTGGTATVCDPTAGFHFTDTTLQNFGRIITKRGHRVIEFALRFFW